MKEKLCEFLKSKLALKLVSNILGKAALSRGPSLIVLLIAGILNAGLVQAASKTPNLSLNAFPTCHGEAQFIGRVASVRSDNEFFCRVDLSPYTITQFNESAICPLAIEEVLYGGFLARKTPYDTCGYEIDSPISGVLVKNQDGVIFLEY